jgi:hypothetical protein
MASGIVRKLFNLSVWNTAAAGINFLANILIARALGVDVFGEFVYLSAIAGLISLLFVLIPPNYAIIRYQDDPSFRFTYTAYFIFINVLLFIPVVLLKEYANIPFWLFYLFVFSSSFQAYIDVVLQAENKLKRYYFLIFIQSVVKILLLGVLLLPGWVKDYHGLVLIISVAQSIIAVYFVFSRWAVFVASLLFFGKMFRLIRTKLKTFYPYYFNISLKRLDSNIIILLFAPLVSKEVLGIYSLLIKVYQFITGLVRTAESLFLYKANIKDYHHSYMKNAWYIAGFLQAGLVLTGLVYMKSTTGSYYFFYIIMLSFLLLPYVFFIKSRANFLASYRNFHINISYILFLLPTVIWYLINIINSMDTSLSAIVILFMISSLLQMIYLIFAENKFNKTVDQS